jgi:hypothetical protein
MSTTEPAILEIVQTHATLITALACALPCFGMGIRLLHVWRKPLEIEHGSWISLGVGVMVIEFILLQTGLFLSVGMADEGLANSIFVMIVLCLFALAIAASFKSRMLLESFLWVIGWRLVAELVGHAEANAKLLESYYILAMILYMSMVCASVILPFPRWGISEELASRFRSPGSSGLWIDSPHRAIGAGAIYFLLLGVATLWTMSTGGIDFR